MILLFLTILFKPRNYILRYLYLVLTLLNVILKFQSVLSIIFLKFCGTQMDNHRNRFQYVIKNNIILSSQAYSSAPSNLTSTFRIFGWWAFEEAFLPSQCTVTKSHIGNAVWCRFMRRSECPLKKALRVEGKTYGNLCAPPFPQNSGRKSSHKNPALVQSIATPHKAVL